MAKSDRVALAKFVMRGKESLVLIRPSQKGLMLHTMYFADEVRDFGEIDKGESAKIRDGELDLAQRLIDELSREEFKPEQYQDEYRRARARPRQLRRSRARRSPRRPPRRRAPRSST